VIANEAVLGFSASFEAGQRPPENCSFRNFPP
jgi:hypothetical protein